MDWYGLDKNGKQVQVTAQDMAKWAYEKDLAISVGWSDHYETPNGMRLVRGLRPEIARKVGWEDIAVLMERFA